MNPSSRSIPKQTARTPAADFYRLRREGIGFIEQMGSRLWTDYNTHDPGVTILEALCYAITDLSYRNGWPIKDILASVDGSTDPDQPFFSAAEILPVNPWTPDDFRRLLIDLDAVRNAWVVCKECSCDVYFYAWCEQKQLQFGWQAPDNPQLSVQTVEPKGLYEVLLELEADPQLGDLNDRKIEHRYELLDDDADSHEVTLELRFPDWALERPDEWALFLEQGAVFNIQVGTLGATKTYNVLTDPELDEEGRDRYLREHWRRVFYLSFILERVADNEIVTIDGVALRILGDSSVRNNTNVADLIALLEDQTSADFIGRYRSKLLKVEQAVGDAKAHLQRHRNLAEDYCRVAGVAVEDIAVCADIEVASNADIEQVQAQIWFAIENYFNPPIPFYTLQELLDEELAVEDIFNGPQLANGFVKTAELEAAGLKTVLRTSDIVNLLMDIEGVVAVNHLLLSKYDSEGKLVAGAADPSWNEDLSQPTFADTKTSAAWLLFVSDGHQPRLYHNLSRFLFYKNGLPFLPRRDEARDTLIQLRGEAERPKIHDTAADLSIPAGTFRDLQAFTPLQYSFPVTYGIGPDGLPAHASTLRRAQAKQLKAYLMVFEQLLGNAFAQLANSSQLFSLDPNVAHTYFAHEFDDSQIEGYNEIVANLDKATLDAITETPLEFLERRNRFLDHLLARFGEQFTEYALLLTNSQGRQIALDQLIGDKIGFLKAYPIISRDRGRAFKYREEPCAEHNTAAIQQRIRLLLGDDTLDFIVVEHLLLRPKFPGDAFYPACADGDCEICGDEDPYSFRLTFVMPGWAAPFDEDLTFREFADRTIRSETPAHLLGKICWIGNDGFTEDPCAAIIDDIAELLLDRGLTEAGERPSQADACACAQAIYSAFSTVFADWFEERTLTYFDPDALTTLLAAEFAAIDPTELSCTSNLSDAALWADISNAMNIYFQDIALHGWQFQRFSDAWCRWLESNATFDWSEERLQQRVQAILSERMLSGSGNTSTDTKRLCNCAGAIVMQYGADFYDWMAAALAAGTTLEALDFSDFSPQPVVLCDEFTFTDGTADAVATLLRERYSRYREVSYRLWVVVHLLAGLKNVYPAATLHDCDDGNDDNPVRLGQTALGG